MKGAKLKQKRKPNNKKWKWIHKWFSLWLGFIVIVWALSGIVLNHRKLVSNIELKRSWMPPAYHFKNWNNSAVKGGCLIAPDSLLLFGNIGIWLTDEGFSTYLPFMEGLPKGMDNRRVAAMVLTPEKNLYAATQTGLYLWEGELNKWYKLLLPLKDERITDLRLKDGKLVVLGRSEVYLATSTHKIPDFNQLILPAAVNDDGKIGLFRTLWVLHSGELWGIAGRVIVDIMALSLIFFALTGYVYFFFPKWIRSRKKRDQDVKKIVTVNRFAVKWHKKLGIWLVFFLLITSLTGIFLRPPLLIPIAHSRIARIPYSLLDNPNTWEDKLRAIYWNQQLNHWLIATDDGLYFCDEAFQTAPQPFAEQPPVSLMGINVLEYNEQGEYLIGSFNGLFRWNPITSTIIDGITGELSEKKTNAASPIGRHMIAGRVATASQTLVFDYNTGLLDAEIPMPEEIAGLPMPLWNLALEIHTGRIVQDLIGIGYIFIVPLFGITVILILVSGLIIYLRRR
ncbi:MAG: PepSY domain-containing protein [Bacteroidales bacterium]|nr:PepSY domain-containing protein [Bacteroidales bacterium]MDD3701824.1 PepSY domain-containing protein [Bacteroidales bacterium]MDY0369730.1 PepSY domain-containing protein [Bacteroidales bacterium]